MKSLYHAALFILIYAILNNLCLFGQIELPEALPAHPRILFRHSDTKIINEKITKHKWAQNQFNLLKKNADSWLNRKIVLPEKGGQWYHYYSCPDHGARLRTESPTRHVCPVDGKVFSGYPYDDVVIMSEHNGFANALKTLGIVYRLTDDKKYAEKAKEILLAYADKYQSYPLHNIRGEPQVGGGKVGPQTLDESTWLITMVEGADCIWDTLSSEETKKVIDGLFIPATDVIRRHKMGIHNIQCWKNSAVGITGLLIGNLDLVKEALLAESGYFNQLKKGVMADGAWYEGAWGYHFYTISALLHLTEACYSCGINIYVDELKKMFDAPILMAMPNLDLPPFNDSQTVGLASAASVYEIAFARFKDERYRLVIESSDRSNLNALLYGIDLSGKKPEFHVVSTNFPASGYAILTHRSGVDYTWFCMDYGPHGGGHGHPDKLSFVLYSKGEVLAPDPGTANYGVPIQANWFRTSIAHNTLTIDETSQRPADGSCVAFMNGKHLCAVLAHAGKIEPDVNFYRTAALFEGNLLLIIDSITSSKRHTFDIAYHQNGVFVNQPGTLLEKLSDKPGYNQLRGIKTFNSRDFTMLEFQSPKKSKIFWMLAGGVDTQVITGTGVGRHTEDRVPVVIARRIAERSTFIWGILINEEPTKNFIQSYSIPEQAQSSEHLAAAKFILNGKPHILVSNPAGVPFNIGQTTFDYKLALFILGEKGELHLIEGTK